MVYAALGPHRPKLNVRFVLQHLQGPTTKLSRPYWMRRTGLRRSCQPMPEKSSPSKTLASTSARAPSSFKHRGNHSAVEGETHLPGKFPENPGGGRRNSSQAQDVKNTTTEDNPRSRLYGIRCTWATSAKTQIHREMRKGRLQKITPEGDCMVYAPLGPHGPKFEQTQHEQKEASTR
jgi:hypothetical protein